MIKWLWLSGWSLPPDWFAGQARAVWPEAEHTDVSVAHAAEALAAGGYDRLGGYSLGALYLLCQPHALPANVPVALFAPIFAFPAEAGRGGRIPRAQLRATQRWLRRDATAAVRDFARRAGLTGPDAPAWTAPFDAAELEAGLAALEEWSALAPPPPNWQGWIGEADPLLDAAVTRRLWPGLAGVAGAGHAPGPLLRAAKTLLDTA